MRNSDRPRLLCLLPKRVDGSAFLDEAARRAELDAFTCDGEPGDPQRLAAGGVALSRLVERLRPDAVVLLVSNRWRPMLTLWWETRRTGYQGLRCVVDLSSPASGPSTRTALHYVRLGLLDAATFAAARPIQAGDYPEQRVRFGAGAADAARFVAARVKAEAKSALWVDPHITERSPSMRSLVWSAAALAEKGWELRCWCNETAIPDALAETVILPRTPGPAAAQMLGFALSCNLFYCARRFLLGKRPAAIIHTTCANLLAADMASVHFCAPAWLEIERRLPGKGWRRRLSGWVLRLAGRLEERQLSSPSLRLMAVVSKGIGQSVRQHHRITAHEVLLPNAYDEQRFSPAVRAQFRTKKRQELGFGDDHFVFAFTSQGHYERKGFWLVVEALTLIPAPWTSNVRLLVIGGGPGQVHALRHRLATEFPSVRQTIDFAGQQPRVEYYLAAADAFILPSYFEAFCLAEIEAAAMGIPLLLSKHHGVEMILKEGENGWLIQHQPSDIAAKMLGLMDGSLVPRGRHLGHALNRQEYADRVDRLYRSLLSSSSA